MRSRPPISPCRLHRPAWPRARTHCTDRAPQAAQPPASASAREPLPTPHLGLLDQVCRESINEVAATPMSIAVCGYARRHDGGAAGRGVAGACGWHRVVLGRSASGSHLRARLERAWPGAGRRRGTKRWRAGRCWFSRSRGADDWSSFQSAARSEVEPARAPPSASPVGDASRRPTRYPEVGSSGSATWRSESLSKASKPTWPAG